MLSGDFQKVRKTIKSRDWPGLKVILEEHFEPRFIKKSIMDMAPELFQEKAQFARPQNDFRCIEELYFPAISTDNLVEKIKQNRRKFL